MKRLISRLILSGIVLASIITGCSNNGLFQSTPPPL